MIFDGLGSSETSAGALRLAERAREKIESDAPWSMCELGGDESDFLWIEAWARNLSPQTLSSWLLKGKTEQISGCTFSRESLIGALLLFAASEIARRYAAEGEIWAHVRRRFDDQAAYNRLFDVQGQPTYEHKLAIQRAASRLHLRNAFDDSEKGWMVTAYLQFGFSRRSIPTRLSAWIAGYYQSTAVQRLAGAGGSQSFQELFRALRAFARGNATVVQASAAIEASPWVLNGDREAVLAAARSVVTTQESKSFTQHVGALRLDWNGTTTPRFLGTVTGLALLAPEQEEVDVFVRGRRACRLIRNSDGSWPDADFPLSAAVPQATISICTPEAEEPLHEEVVTLWNAAREVETFSLGQGQRIEGKASLVPGRRYAIAIAEGLEICPDPDQYVLVAGRRLCLFESLPAEVRVVDTDITVWTLMEAAKRELPSEPRIEILEDIARPLGVPRLGDELRLFLRIAEDVRLEVEDLQVNGVRARVEGTSIVLRMQALLANRPLRAVARVIGDEGRRRVLPRLLVPQIPCFGLVMTGEEEDRELSPSETLESRLLPHVRPLLPPGDWTLFAGTICLGTVALRLGALNRVRSGFGAGLSIAPRKFNVIAEEVKHLCASVVVHGGIESVEIVPDGLELHLSSPLQPDEDRHRLLVWTTEGGINGLKKISIASSDDYKHWRLSHKPANVLALGIAYDGACVHSWRSTALGEWLCSPEASGDAEYVAVTTRWLRLAILSDALRRPLMDLAAKHPAEFVAAWFLPQNADAALAMGQIDAAWEDAARIILRYVEWPGVHTTTTLRKRFGLAVCADSLVRACPRLFRKALIPSLTRDEALGLMGHYAEVAREGQIASAKARLRDDACDRLGVDANFVSALARKLARPDAPPLDRRNGDIALGTCEPFRRLFALECLGLYLQ